MDGIKDATKSIVSHIWKGFLNNLGVIISAFLFSGSYLVVINKIKIIQEWIRGIPTDYVLTPLVFLTVVLFVLVKINKKQKKQISNLEREPIKDEKEARFVTHLGVWWKLYPEAEYIEDFPYCSCCNSKMKLVQLEWYPAETYKCPTTGTEYKLFDRAPRNKHDVLDTLYKTYFIGFGQRLRRGFFSEVRRLKELNPEISDEELTRQLLQRTPFNKIPEEEREKVVARYPNPALAYDFIERYHSSYKRYIKSPLAKEE